MPGSSESDPGLSDPLVSLTDVTVRHGVQHHGDVVALDAVSFQVRPGERVALLGSSGSGKSSLLDVISGRVVPTAGSTTVLGDDPAHALRSNHRRRRAFGPRVGVVRQDGDLVHSLRVIQNVNAGMLGRWSTLRAIRSLIRPLERDDVRRTLERVGLADRIDTVTGDLSGGERQRVAIARVLRQQPELFLADEPTSSVDPTLSDDMMHALAADDAPWTLVVALHDPELAIRHATRVVGLRSGTIVFDVAARSVTPELVDDLYAAGPRDGG